MGKIKLVKICAMVKAMMLSHFDFEKKLWAFLLISEWKAKGPKVLKFIPPNPKSTPDMISLT